MNRIFCFLFLIAYIVVSLPSSQMAFATIINIPDDYAMIQLGINASADGDTVLVQPDIYVENINFNGHNIVLGSLFLTTGDTSYIEQTIIDGDSAGSVITLESGEDNTTILTGFTIRCGYAGSGGGIDCDNNSSPTISNNTISGNSAQGGGGISCIESSPTISNNTITGNSVYSGGGIYCENSNPTINNNTISGNSAFYGGGICCVLGSSPTIQNNTISGNSANWGGGIRCSYSSPTISNNTISGNSANYNGGGIYCYYDSNPVVINTILWANIADYYGNEIYIDSTSSISITYSDIHGGWEGEGNIDANPLFRDLENGDFHLMAVECDDDYNSPCIDAGHPDILDSLLDCSWGLGTVLSDMGAYGGGDSAGVRIDDLIKQLPKRFTLSQNYPNPFNASTTISYNLPNPADITLDIYDILGRKVETLKDEYQDAGYHQVIWQADDFSSGIYFYKLTADDFENTKKMVLLK